jgi:hypothetical protein
VAGGPTWGQAYTVAAVCISEDMYRETITKLVSVSCVCAYRGIARDSLTTREADDYDTVRLVMRECTNPRVGYAVGTY